MECNREQIVVQCFLELNWPKDSFILDIGCGNGIIGQLLKKNGYENIDGLDESSKIIEIPKQNNCYKNLINSIVSTNIRLPIENNVYDVVIIAEEFCPGRIHINAFNEVLRVTKSGEIFNQKNNQIFISSLKYP